MLSMGFSHLLKSLGVVDGKDLLAVEHLCLYELLTSGERYSFHQSMKIML